MASILKYKSHSIAFLKKYPIIFLKKYRDLIQKFILETRFLDEIANVRAARVMEFRNKLVSLDQGEFVGA